MASDVNRERAYTVQTLAESWGVHPNTIRKLVRGGENSRMSDSGRRILIPAWSAPRNTSRTTWGRWTDGMRMPAGSNGGRGRERRQVSLAKYLRVCPLACIAHHTEPLKNRQRRGPRHRMRRSAARSSPATTWADLLAGSREALP